ncbi:MAG: conditioned medium factor [Wenzhouxiangellaceae bacterium]
MNDPSFSNHSRQRCRLGACLAALTLCLSAAALAEPIPKQLAGPPSEFAQMRLPDPATTATTSTSALLPVTLTQDRDGVWRWQGELAADGDNPRMVVFAGNDSSWQTSIVSAAGTPASEQFSSTVETVKHGLQNETFTGTAYRFEQRWQGTARLQISAAQPLQSRGFVLIGSDSPWQLRSWQQHRRQFVGTEQIFHASLVLADAEQNNAVELSADSNDLTLDQAYLRVTDPLGEQQLLPMHAAASTGKAVSVAASGSLQGSFTPNLPGEYVVQVVTRGRSPDGSTVLRTAEHALMVIEQPLARAMTLDADLPAVAVAIDERRLEINLGLQGLQSSTEPFVHAYAEVWGKVGKQSVPVAWIGGMLPSDNPQLYLDSRWIGLAGAEAPFELRQVRIEQADHFITLSAASRMALVITSQPAAATRAPASIDEAMLMGPRPQRDNTRAGARLLLVHGYCSGDAWGPVQGQFANSAKFQDFNQNRSHNQFALQILNFGQQFDSYGIVAHSQGGAAATHLYTFFWSGLDFASPGRLIQSVGTPYRGTALAGNLAALGSVFGVGCGTNTDLTYSGAASWLAGIPSWARAQVNYYTTSFTDVWWRWDYCNIASDLVLSDPEDGTTERTYGQLPGAINRGHKTGWCHTTGMRDPAQVTDASRNSVMNSQAAR